MTLNPCLDVSYEFASLVPDQKVRADHTRFDPGGNGINVGRALKELGLPATNCCILAGEIGILVKRLLGHQLDNLRAIHIPGETRPAVPPGRQVGGLQVLSRRVRRLRF